MLKKSLKFVLLALGLSFAMSAQAATVLDTLFHQANDPVAGNPKGKVTIVEFFDYQCSHCVNMASVIDSIIKNNPDVRVVFKEYPIRGSMSSFASRAALAANMQGKYYPFSHALLTSDSLDQDSVYNLAKSKGLDVKKLKKDMDSSRVRDTIKSNYDIAKSLGIAGTPAFFIGKTDATKTEDVNFVLGEMSRSDLQSAVEKARAS